MNYLTVLLLLTASVCSGQTLLDNRFKVEVSSTDSVQLPHDQDQGLKDSIEKKYNNWHERSRAWENHLLKKYNPGITRDKDGVIEIKLSNGSMIKLTPDKNKGEADFVFEHYFKEHKLLVFRVQWSEGNNYAIIDQTNGKKTYMLGRPFISPDNKFITAINCDIEAQYSDNGFELFQLITGDLKKIWEYNPQISGPVALQWIDKQTFITKNYQLDSSGKYKSDFRKVKIEQNEK
jgi:hypothetical protein